MDNTILIIEDDDIVRNTLSEFLSRNGFVIHAVTSGEAGLELLRTERVDLVITDLVMPGMDGMVVLKEVTAVAPNIPVLIMTGFATVQTAVEAIKIGAFDYITKPFNLDDMMNVLTKALSLSRLQKENTRLRIQLRKKYGFTELIGHSGPMQAVYRLIEKIAATDSTVLITGESGTGKEVIAKTIHFNNPDRANGPFVALNCAAIPHNLLGSELFGHEKGAFTGAISSRMGRFELAQRGTLLLDEVGELDLSLQAKLLRVLQEREFERVGGVKKIKVDVRIIAASNKDLEQATRNGSFREDLFYRLNVIPLHLPPLRSRAEDIPLLIAHFIDEYCRKLDRSPFTIAPEAMDRLLRYQWPGNVRELENLIERLSILAAGRVASLQDLPEKIQQLAVTAVPSPQPETVPPAEPLTGPDPVAELGDAGIDLNAVVSAMERQLITRALERSGGVRSRAAQLLGLNRTTLLEKMKKMKIERGKS